jgi:hypothetical protein
MAAQQQDDFDVLKFFITVMLLLTVIVGGFAAVLQSKVSDTTKQIRRELSTLEAMDKMAGDAQFRDWIARERESKSNGSGSTADFKALVSDHARRIGLNVKDTREAGQIEHPGGTRELQISIRIEGFRLEQLVRFLVAVEQDWPGAKTRQIPDLQLDPKAQTWTGSVILAIFKHNETQGP